MLVVTVLMASALPATASVRAVVEVGSIAGTVTDLAAHPLPGITVLLRWGNTWVRQTQTDASGEYQLDDLVPDSIYQVRFTDPQLVYAPESFNDMIGFGNYVTVTANTVTTGVNASLEPAGRINGRVTTATAAPATSAVLDLYWRVAPGVSAYLGSYGTDQEGRYALALREATYVLYFHDPVSGYSEYWNNQPGQSWEIQKGTPLVVIAGQVLSGVDAVLDGFVVKSLAPPTVTGRPQVGQPLTALPGTWSPAGATVSYQWVVGGVAVSTADPTGSTYVPTTTDVGKTVRVVASATYTDWQTGTAVSALTAPVVPATVLSLVRPRVRGTLRVGTRVWVTYGTWQPRVVTCRYQWYAGGKAIAGATHRRLTLTSHLIGKRLRVRVKAGAAGYAALLTWTRRTARVSP
jgi:hypothetical protein